MGRTFYVNGEPRVEVPIELAVWLVDRAQEHLRIEHNEQAHLSG